MSKNTDAKLKAEDIVCEFFKSKKNSNCLLELEELLLSPDEEVICSVLPVVSDFFSRVFMTGLLKTSEDGSSAEDTYKLWLFSRYEDFVSHLLGYLFHSNPHIQALALKTLMSFVQLESKESLREEQGENQHFSVHLFKRIMSALASDVLNQHSLIKVFQEYTKYHDIKLYLLKFLQQSLLIDESKQISEVFLQNCFFLLYSMKYPKISDDKPGQVFAYQSEPCQPFHLKEKMFRKLFSSIWKCLLNYEFSSEFMQKTLPVFCENILPQLQNPCLMTDFLTNAYNRGGVLSLLALKGLYLLMDKYNLEYPNFFVKLYALLDKNIVNGKFSCQFFEFTNLFLSSTHLPAHIVAAFAKKLARLSLISRTENVLRILFLISNLLATHPSLKTLMHWEDKKEKEEVKSLNEDPFDVNVVDPSESKAIESSLWELKVLQCHVNPSVCLKAKGLSCAYPKTIHANIPDISLRDMYRKLRKHKVTETVPLAVKKPKIR